LDHLLSKDFLGKPARTVGSVPSGSPPGTEATSVPPSLRGGPRRLPTRVRTLLFSNNRRATARVDGCRCGRLPRPAASASVIWGSAGTNCLRVWGVAVKRRRRPLAGGQSDGGRTLSGLSDNPVVGTATRIASWLSSKSDKYAKSVGNSFHPRTWTFKRMRVLPWGSCPGVVRRSWRRRMWHSRRRDADATGPRSEVEALDWVFGNTGPGRRGQASKGTGGMPRRHQDFGRGRPR
jgi:hypothetical protein